MCSSVERSGGDANMMLTGGLYLTMRRVLSMRVIVTSGSSSLMLALFYTTVLVWVGAVCACVCPLTIQHLFNNNPEAW